MFGLTEEIKNDAVTLPRGNPFLMTITTETIPALRDHMADFGFGVEIVAAPDWALISEGAQVDRLNDIRLSDKVLILTGIDWPGATTDAVIFNARTAFCQQGGRAIFLL